VVKSGRTTGVTRGVVTRVGVVVKIDYGGDVGAQQVGGFEIGVNPEKPPGDGEVSMGGDSGSLWLVDTAGADKDVAVGLHFAGETDPNPAAEHAIACAIHSVLQKLQVSFRNPLAGPEGASERKARRPRRRCSIGGVVVGAEGRHRTDLDSRLAGQTMNIMLPRRWTRPCLSRA
jgi:endonuclease G